MSHRKSGRDRPSTEKRSSAKGAGTYIHSVGALSSQPQVLCLLKTRVSSRAPLPAQLTSYIEAGPAAPQMQQARLRCGLQQPQLAGAEDQITVELCQPRRAAAQMQQAGFPFLLVRFFAAGAAPAQDRAISCSYTCSAGALQTQQPGSVPNPARAQLTLDLTTEVRCPVKEGATKQGHQ